MVETIILTIQYNDQAADFELPASVKIKDWITPLQSALRNSFYGIRLQNKKIQLYYENQLLREDESLLNYGIYDGSILVMVLQ